MEKTLVTGGTGLVGSAVIAALLEAKRPVRALVRSAEKARRVVPAEVELFEGDVTDRDAVDRAVTGCAFVHHAAGLPEQWLDDEAMFERVHVGGTKNILAAVLARGVKKLVYTSTIDVFAAEQGGELDESRLDPHEKGTAYERSKQHADRVVVEAIERDKVPAVLTHPAALYGPGPAGSPGINDFIVKLRDKKAPMLIPGGMPVVYSRDIGRGHLLAEGAAPGSRYILSDRYYELKEMAEIIARELGLAKVPPVMPVALARVVAGAGELLSSVTKSPPLIPKGQLHFLQWRVRPKNDRARRELGWVPTPFPEAVKATIAYLSGS